MSPKKSMIKDLLFQGMSKDLLNTMMKDDVWFPGVMIEQPLGQDTKYYGWDEVAEMIYDI